MLSRTAPEVRIYVTDYGDVRIETPHRRQTLPPSEFIRRLYAALPPGAAAAGRRTGRLASPETSVRPFGASAASSPEGFLAL